MTAAKKAAGTARGVITFGGKDWKIAPLSWESIAELTEAFTATHGLSGRDLVKARFGIIVLALKLQADEASLRALPSDLVEIFTAVEGINDALGYDRLGELMMARVTESSAKAGTTSSPAPAPSPDGPEAKSAG
ncbi:hypothetical protein [Paramagnetospirillum magneticum]|uniref:Uncharacterized protein n=1 Tax=Paramagnetospirillum magneticum (strain ATCC 700264 / AMB-1) TaxID=342108 RepID=Q2W6E6_PARM1|nr:hypothetical protein [Paramagnetospirillum magneticum]BAE50579.1 hypothetical protein amb1775 [Paramagnetospirillum magneticum AMB-1]